MWLVMSDLQKWHPPNQAHPKCDTLAQVAHPLALGVTGWRYQHLLETPV